MEGFVHVVTKEDEAALRAAKVLVVPLLSVGNVPQLTVDLLVNSLRLPRCGIVVDRTVEPICSSNVYGSEGELSFACELFARDGVAWLQLRSKLRDNQIGSFALHLAQFAAEVGFEQVLVLGSCDSGWLEHPDVENLKVKYLCSTEQTAARLEEMGLRRMAWSNEEAGSGRESMEEAVLGRRTLPQLLDAELRKIKLERTGLHLFCGEGENVPESHLLARVALGFLEKTGRLPEGTLEAFEGVAPRSWKVLLEDANPETVRALFQ